jgi:hypothetical protein
MDRQLTQIKRQLDDSEAAQSAELVIEDLSGDASPTGDHRSTIHLRVTNIGQTTAKEIALGGGTVTWHVDPEGLISIEDGKRIDATIKPIAPNPNGFSLGPGKSKEFDFEDSMIDELVKSRMGVSQTYLFGYKDIFGNSKFVGDCIFFIFLSRTYQRCHPYEQNKFPPH